MPRWPKRVQGMEQSNRARRRKPETAKANLEPPRKEHRRTGCPPRGGIRRVCGEVPGRSQWRLLQGRTGRQRWGKTCLFRQHSRQRARLIEACGIRQTEQVELMEWEIRRSTLLPELRSASLG